MVDIVNLQIERIKQMKESELNNDKSLISPELFETEVWGSLSGSARSVLFCLASYADKSGDCFPSIPTISKNLKKENYTVVRSITELMRNGLLTINQESGENTYYRLHLDLDLIG